MQLITYNNLCSRVIGEPQEAKPNEFFVLFLKGKKSSRPLAMIDLWFGRISFIIPIEQRICRRFVASAVFAACSHGERHGEEEKKRHKYDEING